MSTSISKLDKKDYAFFETVTTVPNTNNVNWADSNDSMHDYYGKIDTDTSTWVQFFSEANYGGVSYLVAPGSNLPSLKAVFNQKIGSFRVLDHAPELGNKSWEEEYAYTLGMQAYIWGFPWIYSDYLRWLWTSPEGQALANKGKPNTLPQMAMNSFYSAPQVTSGDNTGGSPNCDVLYSIAWLDLIEPVVLYVPAVTDRYYTMELFCMDSDNFAYVGTRATGIDEGYYLIVGPEWKGNLSKAEIKGILQDIHEKSGIKIQDILPRSRTRIAGVMGRTKVKNGNADDLTAALAVQQKYSLCPLSKFLSHSTVIAVEPPKTSTEYPGYRWPLNPTIHTANAFERMNWAMTHNPPGLAPGIDQSELIALYATIGVGPNQNVHLQSLATQRGLERAAHDGLVLLKNILSHPMDMVNYWSYPPRITGRAGQNNDFITRATTQSLGGICANDCIENVYLNTSFDSDGNKLSAEGKYQIDFNDTDSPFPPIDTYFNGYWSITMYETPGYNIVSDSEHYNVNSDMLASQADKSKMTILIQQEDPGTLPTGNYWLQSPTPEDGKPTPSLYFIIRIYMPGPEVSFTQTWQPPGIKKVG